LVQLDEKNTELFKVGEARATPRKYGKKQEHNGQYSLRERAKSKKKKKKNRREPAVTGDCGANGWRKRPNIKEGEQDNQTEFMGQQKRRRQRRQIKKSKQGKISGKKKG